MKFSIDHLRSFAPTLPEGERDLRDLLDNLGLEVKSVDDGDEGRTVTIEFLANRGDHRCYVGVAREIAASASSTVQLPESAPIGETRQDPLVASVESNLCLAYAVAPIEIVDRDAQLDDAVVERLRIAGQAVDGRLVDATGAANLELGQPMHAFDADLVDGPITVRTTRAGEQAWLLGEDEPRELSEGTLVVADAAKVLAVAGVIGCQDSAVRPETRRALLESATFDPVAVRRTSRELGVQTASSMRFERGSDPAAPLTGIARALYLVEAAGLARRSGEVVVAREWDEADREIELDIDVVNDFYGTEFTEHEIDAILGRLEFRRAADGAARYVVPSFRRWEVEQPEDLLEEIGRLVGFDTLLERLPVARLGTLPTPVERGRELVDEVLLAAGFFETVTDGFYGRDVPGRLRAPADDAHVAVANSIDKRYSLLKNNCLAHALEAVGANERFREDDLKLFEWTRTFAPKPAGAVAEAPVFWAVATGCVDPRRWDQRRDVDVYFLRGLIEQIGAALRLPLRFGEPDPTCALAHALHPVRQLSVLLGDEVVGAIAEVHPDVVRSFGIKRLRPVYLEIDATRLELQQRWARSRPTPGASTERMISLVVRRPVRSAQVQTLLAERAPEFVRAVELSDVFESAALGEGHRSITYRVVVSSDPSITAEMINDACRTMIEAAERGFEDGAVVLR